MPSCSFFYSMKVLISLKVFIFAKSMMKEKVKLRR